MTLGPEFLTGVLGTCTVACGVSNFADAERILMTPSHGNNDQPNDDQSSIQQAADKHAGEILARRRESRARRAAALAAHPPPLTVKTEVTQAPLAPASAPPAA